MNRRETRGMATALVLLALTVWSRAEAAEIKVLSTVGMQPATTELFAQFDPPYETFDNVRLGPEFPAELDLVSRLNAQLAPFRILTGIEVDILEDGTMDFPDEVLAELDVVLGAVHSRFKQSREEMTARIVRALANPHVDILAHPTGRLLLKRDPYQIDIPAVLDAAARTGTWIELNASAKRLDLDWRWWPLAKQKGVKCVINPDAHRAERLQDLWFGIGIARKGWLTKIDVVNCVPLSKMESELTRKRGHS